MTLVEDDVAQQTPAEPTTQQPDPSASERPQALPTRENPPQATLDLSSGSGTATLPGLGPMVVNVDGTISRIANWDQMAEVERQNTLRILKRRNKVRLDALKAQEENQGSAN